MRELITRRIYVSREVCRAIMWDICLHLVKEVIERRGSYISKYAKGKRLKFNPQT
jgi:hypothetical protein